MAAVGGCAVSCTREELQPYRAKCSGGRRQLNEELVVEDKTTGRQLNANTATTATTAPTAPTATTAESNVRDDKMCGSENNPGDTDCCAPNGEMMYCRNGYSPKRGVNTANENR